ncbi:diguanylate cyclase [Nocardioides sp.]|uniref:GGDEF domain-containing protein n=1 Tax=Nocardioides sp. TaxID=35761 RepID=UPI0027257A28|nr:sensor domain-containing diguanylate cyclase [Nocardioides sp.]MDO9454558.1 diguanylate cyclase [Nocardioides sp.]
MLTLVTIASVVVAAMAVARLRQRGRRLTALTTERAALQRQWERLGEELPDTVVLVLDADLRHRRVSGTGDRHREVEPWVGRTLAECSPPADVRLLEPLYRAALDGLPGSVETRPDGDGTPQHHTVVPYTWEGSPAVLVVARDVRPVHQHEADPARSVGEGRPLSHHDPLTGLVNRRSFDEVLAEHLLACADVTADGPCGAVVVLDIDHFQRVNDALGHHVGDRLIVSVSELLMTALRETDVVARLGGDEFAVLLRDADDVVASRVAQRVVDVVRRHTAGVPEVTGAVTASAGVRVITDVATSAHDLMVDADTAMYDAKRAGRDRFVMA